MDLRKAKQIAAKLDGVRSFAISDVEIRQAPDGSSSPGGVRFYAALYDSRSLDLGGFTEEIRAGAFDTAVAEDDIRALVNHDPNLILGRSAPAKGVSTAIVTSDERGLLVDIPELPDTQAARDLLVSLERGDVDQCSFGFRLAKGGDEWRKDGDTIVRTLTEVRLFDVSIVTFPAYPDTTAEARSLALALSGLRSRTSYKIVQLAWILDDCECFVDWYADDDADKTSMGEVIALVKAMIGEQLADATDSDSARGLRQMERRDGSTIYQLGWIIAECEDFVAFYADDDEKAAMKEVIARLKAMVAVEAADDADDDADSGDRSQDANDLELAAARLRALALAVPETTPTTNEEGAA